MVEAKTINWRLVRLALVTTALGIIGMSAQPKPALALTVKQNQVLGYPHSQMPCEHYPYNVSGKCANYDWGPTRTEVYDHPSQYSSRGYTYRNCTDYVAWKLGTLGAKVPKGLGNAADWYGRVGASQRLSRAKAWSVAYRSGGFGHVAFVESVNSVGSTPANDVITISEYNFYGLGTGSIRTGRVAELGFTGFISFGVHPKPPAAKPVAAPKPTPPKPAAPVVVPAVQQPTNPTPIVAAPANPVPRPTTPAVADPTPAAPTTVPPAPTKLTVSATTEKPVVTEAKLQPTVVKEEVESDLKTIDREESDNSEESERSHRHRRHHRHYHHSRRHHHGHHRHWHHRHVDNNRC